MSAPTKEGTPDDLVRQAQQTANDIFSAINRALGTRCSFTDNAKAKTAAGLVVIFESIRKAGLAKQAEEIARLKEELAAAQTVWNHSSVVNAAVEESRQRSEECAQFARWWKEATEQRDTLRQQLAGAESALAAEQALRARTNMQLVAQAAVADEFRRLLIEAGWQPDQLATPTDALRKWLLEVAEKAYWEGAMYCGHQPEGEPVQRAIRDYLAKGWQVSETRRALEEGK